LRYEWRLDLVGRSLGPLLFGLGVTILVCALAFTIAIVVGLLVGFARLSHHRMVSFLARLYVDVVRSTPLLVQLIWVYYALPMLTRLSLSLYETAILGLSLYGSAYLGEVFRGGILSLGKGQFEAGFALGLTAPQVWRRIILPQAIVRMLPPVGSTLISLLKESALLSVIGVPELMFQMLGVNTTTFRTIETFSVGAALYFVVTYPIALGVNWLYRRQLAVE
jgi:polar amino acid transport system permease protein